jgi:hypothetical protein
MNHYTYLIFHPMKQEQKDLLSSLFKGKPWSPARRAAQEARYLNKP